MKLTRVLPLALASVLAMVLVPLGGAARSAAAQARDISILVGAGQDTVDLRGFFPEEVRIRAGDSITWTQNSDAAHTVSFFGPFPGLTNPNPRYAPDESPVPGTQLRVPGRPGVNMLNPLQVWPYPGPEVSGSIYRGGEFVSSGRLLAVPPTPGVDEITTFSLTFDTPGTYRYVCLTHPAGMQGSVEVAAASARDVSSQAEIDARAQSQIDALVARSERQRAQQANSPRSEPGANGSSLWFVSAGANQFRINDGRAQLDEFFPKDVTVASGDTVVWGSTGGHAVTFNPSPINPPNTIFETLPDGSPAVIQNPLAFNSIKPTGVFDPTQYYVSGNLAAGQPSGTAWALAFEMPGTFEYYCAVHVARGMKGSITVVASAGANRPARGPFGALEEGTATEE